MFDIQKGSDVASTAELSIIANGTGTSPKIRTGI